MRLATIFTVLPMLASASADNLLNGYRRAESEQDKDGWIEFSQAGATRRGDPKNIRKSDNESNSKISKLETDLNRDTFVVAPTPVNTGTQPFKDIGRQENTKGLLKQIKARQVKKSVDSVNGVSKTGSKCGHLNSQDKKLVSGSQNESQFEHEDLGDKNEQNSDRKIDEEDKLNVHDQAEQMETKSVQNGQTQGAHENIEEGNKHTQDDNHHREDEIEETQRIIEQLVEEYKNKHTKDNVRQTVKKEHKEKKYEIAARQLEMNDHTNIENRPLQFENEKSTGINAKEHPGYVGAHMLAHNAYMHPEVGYVQPQDVNLLQENGYGQQVSYGQPFGGTQQQSGVYLPPSYMPPPGQYVAPYEGYWQQPAGYMQQPGVYGQQVHTSFGQPLQNAIGQQVNALGQRVVPQWRQLKKSSLSSESDILLKSGNLGQIKGYGLPSYVYEHQRRGYEKKKAGKIKWRQLGNRPLSVGKVNKTSQQISQAKPKRHRYVQPERRSSYYAMLQRPRELAWSRKRLGQHEQITSGRRSFRTVC